MPYEGIVWMGSPALGKSVAGLPESMGRIVKIMLANNIPVALREPIPLPAEPVKRPDGVKLPVSNIPKLKNNPPFELPSSYKLKQDALLATGWNNLMAEDFEGVFPSGSWTQLGDPTWDDDDYNPHYGYWSAWCARQGSIGLDPQYSNYPNNMDGWMIYGPFDLSAATAAAVDFYWWNESEPNYDFLEWRASYDGINFNGWQTSGNSTSWSSHSFDLSNVPVFGSMLGDNSVWIAFRFTSDSSITYRGGFIDDIVLRANITGPRIDSISPTSGPAGTGTVVTINGQYFGETPGSVTFRSYYNGTFFDLYGEVQSWTNTQIRAMPVTNTYLGRSPCSGPLKVRTDRGDAQRDFTVTFAYSGWKWTTSVPFRINPNTADCTGEELAVKAAAQTWNDVYGAYFIFDCLSTTATGPTRNYQNEIVWAPLSSGNVAETQPYLGAGNNLDECDIVFNDNYSWQTSGIPFTYDVQNIATHELGHCLYLMDLYGGADSEKTMYGWSSDSGETKKRTLEPQDVAGIQYIYQGESPTANTNSASNITSNSAILNGNLTSLGTAYNVHCSFQWGTTSGSYSNETTPPTDLSSPATFTFSLTGLTAATTYYYRAKAAGDGTNYGAEQSFTTTTIIPPTITTYAATSIGAATATVNGSLTGLGSDSSASLYFEYYGPGGAYPGTTVTATPSSLSTVGNFLANLTGLTSGATYHFRAKAIGSSSGTTVYGQDLAFTTAPSSLLEVVDSSCGAPDFGACVDGSMARIYGRLRSDGGFPAQITVYWKQTDHDLGPTEIGWDNQFSLGYVPVGPFSYVINGVSSGTQYFYRFKAYNGVNVAWSATAGSFTVGPLIITPPNHDIKLDDTHTVNVPDSSLLASDWNRTGPQAGWTRADCAPYSGDGTVNTADLSLLCSHWNEIWTPPGNGTCACGGGLAAKPGDNSTSTAPALGTAAISVTPSMVAVKEGQAFTLDIPINSTVPTNAAAFELSYDPRLIQVNSIKEGDFFKKWADAHGQITLFMPGKIDNVNGKVSLTGVAVTGKGSAVTGRGTLFTLNATAVSKVSGNSPLNVTNAQLANTDVKDRTTFLPCSVSNSAVQVTGGVDVGPAMLKK